MKYLSFLLPLVAIIAISSCSKEAIAPAPAPESIDSIALFRKMKDSCSYTIEGQQYNAYQISSGFRIGTAGANLDTTNRNWRWSADTSQFLTGYSIYNTGLPNAPDYASLGITFVRNYNNRDLAPRLLPVVRMPTTEGILQMYALGKHPFALDYQRTNYQNGVAISVGGANGTGGITYINAYAYGPTTIAANSQANSVFEVTRLQKLSDNQLDYLLEARFTASIFNNKEESRKLEKGYIRLHIRSY